VPRQTDGDDDALEQTKVAQMLQAPTATAEMANRLFAAAAADDFTTFASTLAALCATGQGDTVAARESETLCTLMREGGATASGVLPTGTAVWGLVQGGAASRQLRQGLTGALGLFGPSIFATIAASNGATITQEVESP
jgi:hypothetical protein